MALKIKETKEGAGKSTLKCEGNTPAEVAEAVDEYVEASRAIKDLEAKRDTAKLTISGYALGLFGSKCVSTNTVENFKIEGNSCTVTYIVQNRSGAITGMERDQVVDAFGEKVANEVLELDYASFRLNPEVFADEAKRKKVEAVLEKLEKEFGTDVILPGNYKLAENAISKAMRFLKKSDDIVKLIKLLKIVNYPRS